MAVNFADLEVVPAVPSAPVIMPSACPAPVVLPSLDSPSMPEPPAAPTVIPAAVPSAIPVAAPAAPAVKAAAALDRSPSYWVRRRREQELMARALMNEASG
jgi:hypothetical protein